jgi:hypothetical protein
MIAKFYRRCHNGNVYRPNTDPLANLHQAIDIHDKIFERIENNINHAECNIQIQSDFNLNMLNTWTYKLE